jgi:SAM-dependent methyltransferase
MTALARQYAKLCDLRDFDDPALLEAIRSLIPERDPREHIERKVWEMAMVMLFLGDAGHLNQRSEVLSVGAGDERILFWLTNHVGRMVATDIYGEGPFSHQEASASMLRDPAAHAPDYAWRSDRLEVLKMDGRRLEFPDASFDAVFTVSSIEHFGTRAEIALAAAEIGRVLRPGGHAVIVTDYLVRLHPFDRPAVAVTARALTLGHRGRTARLGARRGVLGEAFTGRELKRHVIEASGLEPIQRLDASLSPESWTNLVDVVDDGRLRPRTGQPYPLVLLRWSRSVWTSVCLPLVKGSG